MQRTKCDLKYNKKGIHIYIKQDRKTNKSPTDTQTHMPITLQFNHHENQFSLFVRLFFFFSFFSQNTLSHTRYAYTFQPKARYHFQLASQPAPNSVIHTHLPVRHPHHYMNVHLADSDSVCFLAIF